MYILRRKRDDVWDYVSSNRILDGLPILSSDIREAAVFPDSSVAYRFMCECGLKFELLEV